MTTVVLSDLEVRVMRALRTNDATDNPIGLNAFAIAATCHALGYPLDTPVGDVRRLTMRLRERGLVQSVRHRVAGQSRTTFRLTADGRYAISEVPETTPPRP